MKNGGEGGIRTPGGLVAHTRFPSELLKPLGHPSTLNSRLLTGLVPGQEMGTGTVAAVVCRGNAFRTAKEKLSLLSSLGGTIRLGMPASRRSNPLTGFVAKRDGDGRHNARACGESASTLQQLRVAIVDLLR